MKAALVKRLDAWKVQIEEIRDEIDTLKSEQEDIFNDRSEKWQEGDKGQQLQQEIDSLQEIYDYLDSAISSFEEATSH